MSEELKFSTGITSLERLHAACERMKQQGFLIDGPHRVTDRPLRATGEKKNGYTVHFKGHETNPWRKWTSAAFFVEGPNGQLTGEMDADNYSDYYDNRQIDPITGARIPDTGKVHPKVLSGEKQVGEDGRWGDIRYLNTLQCEYGATAMDQAVMNTGGRIQSEEYVSPTCKKIVLELPA